MAAGKTNAMRILDRAKISYRTYEYSAGDGAVDGLSVAQKLGISPEKVYKTLVTKGASGECFVFVIPVGAELDLKAAARAVKEKAVTMLPLAQLTAATGYIRGGCSPIGMKKDYHTVIDDSALALSEIVVSAGKIGRQIELCPQALAQQINAAFAPIVQE